MMIQRRVEIYGVVQGVSFRKSLLEEVLNTKEVIKGYVKNRPDGSVEAVLCGQPEPVLKIVAYCQVGPARAKVERLIVREEPVNEKLNAFQII
jgi:acylphosphatase